jgi:hypothetical protein
MTDLMDERLRNAARHWRDEQPRPPAVPLDRLVPAPRGGGRRPYAALAAAAVLVVAGSAVAIGHLGSSGTTASPTVPQSHRVGTEHPGTIPWADLPAAHPQVRTTLPPQGNEARGGVVTPFDRVSATGTIHGEAAPGDVITFDAVLESSTDLSLDPCPDYNIWFGRHDAQTWQLNCTAVPYHDAEGRPYLPAFTNVRFEMRVTVPDEPGTQKVLWTLDGPQQMPGFYGLVHVRPAG